MKDFYIKEISEELFKRMYGKSFKEYCTISKNSLRYIHLKHKTISGDTLQGEMVVNEAIANTVMKIFINLYDANYPIEKIHLIDEYDADDEMSMRDNNSSSFNFRYISHTKVLSKHALGFAVDINPLYNPYTKIVDGIWTVEPETGYPYLDREKEFPYKIDENDLAYKLFTEAGFEWGGHWEDQKDYQHFEIPDNMVETFTRQIIGE